MQLRRRPKPRPVTAEPPLTPEQEALLAGLLARTNDDSLIWQRRVTEVDRYGTDRTASLDGYTFVFSLTDLTVLGGHSSDRIRSCRATSALGGAIISQEDRLASRLVAGATSALHDQFTSRL